MCQHTGDYSLSTRIEGYSYARVYHCKDCGANIAMDTLPHHLYQRMYPLKRLEAVQSAEPTPALDFCIMFSESNARSLSRMFFWSLLQTTDVRNVKFHLVNKNLQTEVFAQIVDMAPKNTCVYNRPASRPNWSMIEDTEFSCNWMIENCGTEQFVVLSHFDLFFTGDLLSYFRKLITPQTGMLGQHCPFMILNREAFRRCRIGFYAAGPFKCVVREGHTDQFYIYHPSDPRAAGASFQTGFDTGELLELELRELGYYCDPMRDVMHNHFYHITGGGRVTDGPEFISIQERARGFIQEYCIQ